MQTGRSSVAAVESRYRLRSVATPHGIYSGVMLMSRKPLVLFLQFGFYVFAGCDNAPTVIEALPAIAESRSQEFTSHSTVGALQAQRDTRLLCSSDADCFHTGCFGQLCASQGIVTSCEFRCEYACYQQAARARASGAAAALASPPSSSRASESAVRRPIRFHCHLLRVPPTLGPAVDSMGWTPFSRPK